MLDQHLQSRIRQHVTVAANGCWIWTGATRLNYGAIKVAGKVIGAHVASFIAFNGPVPVGQIVMHACDVRSCVNPAHLQCGTHSDNTQDAASKNRIPGKSVGRALTDQEITAILDKYDHGMSKREIQKEYGVPPTTLTRLLVRHGREAKADWITQQSKAREKLAKSAK